MSEPIARVGMRPCSPQARSSARRFLTSGACRWPAPPRNSARAPALSDLVKRQGRAVGAVAFHQSSKGVSLRGAELYLGRAGKPRAKEDACSDDAD